LFKKIVEVVRDTQLRKDIPQFSHTVVCVWKWSSTLVRSVIEDLELSYDEH
jgi:hypothetical protein